MPDNSWWQAILAGLQSAWFFLSQYSWVIDRAQLLVKTNFGETGVLAFNMIGLALVGYLAFRLIKLLFTILIYWALPAAALAFLATLFFPYSFEQVIPVTAAACTLLFVFKS